ncbi:MAG: sigma 54-interacting transcriptional regulator [Hydrogenophilus sp.]|nr:sigma 54-interacting transcriptional regulator [Hydrogenophilus sp.]
MGWIELPGLAPILPEINSVAASSVAVLLLGETGVGKTMLARYLHEHSPRAHRSFVAVNCAAIPEALFEAELFGHTRGAFTGAIATREGLLARADGGTLFLDEIAELSPAMQSKLLSVVQEKWYYPLGANTPRRSDFRLITATHTDLKTLVAERRFRADLYYRLAVFPIIVPPLRDRPADILVIARRFFATHALTPTPRLEEALCAYSWPGNLRELENTLEYIAVKAAARGVADLDHLPPDFGRSGPILFLSSPGGNSDLSRRPRRSPSLEEILAALDRHRGNRARAARELGIGRVTLWRRLKRAEAIPS